MLSCHRIVFQTNELDKSARSHFASGVHCYSCAHSGLIEHSLCVARCFPIRTVATDGSPIDHKAAARSPLTRRSNFTISRVPPIAPLPSPTLSIRCSLLSALHLERSGLPAIGGAPR